MRFHGRFLRLLSAVLCLLASVVRAGTAYEVRFWIRGGGGAPTHTAYGVAYTSASEIITKMTADGWVLRTEHYSTSNLNAAPWICAFAMPGTNFHWDGRMTSDGDGSVLCNDNRKMYIMYPNWYYPNKSFTEMLNYPLQMCYNCFMGDTINHGSGFVSWMPYVYAVNSDNMPMWAWGNPPNGVKSTQPVFSADATQIVGFTMETDPADLPDGAIESGVGANGSWQFNSTTPPHWVWTPGMEPVTEGGTDTSSADAAAIKASIDAVGAQLIAAAAASGVASEHVQSSLERLEAQAAAADTAARSAAADYKASVDAFKTASLAQTASEAASTRAAIAAAQSAAAADAAVLRSGLGSDIAALKAQAASDAAAARSAAASASASQVATLEALRAAQAASAVEASTAAAAAQTAAAEAKAQATLDSDRVVNAINSAKAQAASDAAAAQAATAAASVAQIAAVEASKVQAAADAAAARSAAAAAVAGANADLMGFKVQAATDAAVARDAAAAFSAAQIAASDAFKAQAAADAAASRSAAAYDALSIKNAVLDSKSTPVDLSPLLAESTAIKLALTADADLTGLGESTPLDLSQLTDALNQQAANKSATIAKGKEAYETLRNSHKMNARGLKGWVGGLTGSWANLGRVPIDDIDCGFNVGPVHLPFKFEFSKMDYMMTKTRAIEVVMLWVYFGYRLMALYSSSVGASKGES